VERIDHVGVASQDTGAGIDAFSTRMGFPIESRQTDVEVSIAVESFTSDTYGVVSHTRPPEIVGGLRVAFVTVGDAELELLQDLDPREGTRAARGPGNTRGDRSAIARFIAARGPGLHHLALKVDDIDAALASLAAAGVTVIDRVGRPGSRRARIGFLHPSSLGGVLVHLVERTPLDVTAAAGSTSAPS
jgi:catechol 2,3-dioxygenase-like lactoylglutathione lyase family enzyme